MTAVPAGALAKLPPPALTLTWMVRVWSVPIGLAAVWGVIWMFASTNVLTAGPLLPPVPLVVTVKGVGVPSDPVQLALPVTLPGVGEVKVIVHWPAASVFGPAVVHVPGRGRVGRAVAVGQRDVDVGIPRTATKPAPAPRSFSRVTVNVCGPLISLVAFGVIEIRALTQVLTAGPRVRAGAVGAARQCDALRRRERRMCTSPSRCRSSAR